MGFFLLVQGVGMGGSDPGAPVTLIQRFMYHYMQLMRL